jgi:hypothetical protein
LESPYAGDVERNMKYARMALLDSLNRGEAPIASHLLYTQVLNDNNPDERKQGIEAGLEWKEVAEGAVFYIDLGMSRGMVSAAKQYIEHQIPVEFREILKGVKS